MMRFERKVCVVNGAASEIGRAVAERLEAEGGTVVGVDLVGHDVGAESLRADLTDEEQVRQLYADVAHLHGRLDVVYNNMGAMELGDLSLLNTEVETWRRVQEVNLTSVFLSCKHAVPWLRESDPSGGSIVNASSFLGDIGSATAQMGFAAAKAGVVQLTRDLGVHLARSAIRVNAVLFGPIDTAAQRAIFEFNPGGLQKRMVHWPMGRFGTLEEAAAAVAFLASDDAGFITATALPLDGGITRAFTVPDA
jgi:NAD(P)-dependent dehydrogenase (short-subunit alcohol dehydrogenase family)